MILVSLFREAYGIAEIWTDFYGYPSSSSYQKFKSINSQLQEKLVSYERQMQDHFYVYEKRDQKGIPVDYDEEAEKRDGKELAQILTDAKNTYLKHQGTEGVLDEPLNYQIDRWLNQTKHKLYIVTERHPNLSSTSIEQCIGSLSIDQTKKESILDQLKDINYQFDDLLSVYKNLPFYLSQFNKLYDTLQRSLSESELDISALKNFIQVLKNDFDEAKNCSENEDPIWDF
ncbi:MAG: hypothetical protein MJZ34_14415 [Paludibacteraceae bacterium]|nr:hypothetical protein [Paludibacteraceae bacterium]